MAQAERTYFDTDIDEKVSISVASGQIAQKSTESASHHMNLA